MSSVRSSNFEIFRCLIALVVMITLLRVLQYSWVTDDAFITFRSVLNFVAGDGAVFNIGERVQSYTHPLWFMLLAFGGLLDLNLYVYSIIIGLLFTGLVFWCLLKIHRVGGARENVLPIVLAFFVLAASESFVSFSTSGLENSLSNFLAAISIFAVVSDKNRVWFYLAAALAVLNRFDNIFFLTPLVLGVTYMDWRRGVLKLWKPLVAALPLVAWHLTSLVYYGFLFPNTKYAKVGGRSLLENVHSGGAYLIDSLQAEWHVFFLLITMPLLAAVALRRHWVSVEFKGCYLLILCGIYLHLTYVLLIAGGDFMRGRFLTIDVLGLAISLLFIRLKMAASLQVIFILLAAPMLAWCAWVGEKELIPWPQKNVANERNYYKAQLGLNLNPAQNYTQHPWAIAALSLGESRAVVGVVGQRGYWMPRQTYLLDKVGLTDAFVARLKIIDNSRTGHFVRDIPKEYLQEKIDGVVIADWADKDAQMLSEKLKLAISSEVLFSQERLIALMWLWKRYGI